MSKALLAFVVSHLMAVLHSHAGLNPDTSSNIVFWGNFKKGDLVHYYTTKQVVDFYRFTKRIEADSTYYFEETVDDFVEMKFNNEEMVGVNYTCFPNDTIEVQLTGRNSYRLRSRDPIRQRELDWQYELYSAGLLSLQHIAFDQWKIKEAYDQSMESLEHNWRESRISTRFYGAMKHFLVCAYINQALYPILVDRQPHPDIDIRALFGMFTADERYLQLYTNNMALLNLAKASVSQLGLPWTKANVLAAAARHFEGRVRDYIPTAFVCVEIENNTFDYADEALLISAVNDPFYNAVLVECYDRKFDQESVLISLSGQPLQLADIVNVGNDTLLYVDFWASWCVPCMEEMKHYPELLDRFRDENVRFIFISLDSKAQDWMNEVKKHAFMDGSNSFMFNDHKNDRLVKELGINAIPRYVVFRNGKIYARNAARPSNIHRLEDFISAMKVTND